MARKKIAAAPAEAATGTADAGTAPEKSGRRKKARAKKARAASKKPAAARKAARSAASDAKRTPGPGAEWIHTNPAEIQAFRTEHGLTEAATARALGVSVGTLRNWTLHGKSAMAKMQRAVKKAMTGFRPEVAKSAAKRAPAAVARPTRAAREPDSALVAEMVIAYIRRGGEIRGDLVDYIERVKSALSL